MSCRLLSHPQDKILRLQNALKQRERKLADAHEANREEAPPNIAAMEERLEVRTSRACLSRLPRC